MNNQYNRQPKKKKSMEKIKKFKTFLEGDSKFVKVRIGENNLKCELCKVNSDGLIGRPIKGDGMFFSFPKKMPLSFHTKGCIESIDIIFILDSKIVKIESDCQPNTPKNFECRLADTVIELPGKDSDRLGIKIGDLIVL